MNKKALVTISCLGAIALSFFATSKAYSLYIVKDSNIEVKIGMSISEDLSFKVTDGDSINYKFTKVNDNKYQTVAYPVERNIDLYVVDSNSNIYSNYSSSCSYHVAYNSNKFRSFENRNYKFTLTRENAESAWEIDVTTPASSTMSVLILSDANSGDDKHLSTPYAYCWKSGIPEKAWPGEAMTSWYTNQYGQQVYYYSIAKMNCNRAIFNNNNGKQTVDIILEEGNSDLTKDYYRFYLDKYNSEGKIEVKTW